MTDAYERAKADDEAWEREHRDTRENLEAEIRKLMFNLYHIGYHDAMYPGRDFYDKERGKKFFALLDRQAAITTRECTAVSELGCEACRAAQKRVIAELQAKADELNAQNTRLNAGWAEANARAEKLRAELDVLRERSGKALPDGVTWPRFEDGKLARFGDRFIHNNGKYTLSGVRFSEGYTTINGLHVTVPLKRAEHTVELHIGQEVCVHGYVDEVRDGTVIIRNDGGYFGTAPSEIRELMGVCDD